jgi:hypothetical protein
MATEAQVMTKLTAIYFVVSSTIETIGTIPDLFLTKRTIKVFKTDTEGKVPIGDIKYLEWYTYKLGVAGEESVFLTKKSEIDVVDDILARVT